MSAKAIDRWYSEMPREEEMLPKDKYTIFDRKEKKYRKGIHSQWHPKSKKFLIETLLILISHQNYPSGRESVSESILQGFSGHLFRRIRRCSGARNSSSLVHPSTSFGRYGVAINLANQLCTHRFSIGEFMPNFLLHNSFFR